jgi:hypothetical protein
VCRSLLEDLSLRRKIRRVRAFESFKRKKEAQVVVQKEIEGSEFSEENSRNSEDHRIQESCGEVKRWIDPPSKGRS